MQMKILKLSSYKVFVCMFVCFGGWGGGETEGEREAKTKALEKRSSSKCLGKGISYIGRF